MFQQLISEVNEIQRLSEKRKGSTAPVVNPDAKMMYRALHRSTFRKPVVPPEITTSHSRYYFETTEQFRYQLKSFNRDQRNSFQCVGYANIKLRFCGRCYDAGKNLPLDLYFVNRKPNRDLPRNLCLGCLGVFLEKRMVEVGEAKIKNNHANRKFEPARFFMIESPESTL